MSGRGHFEGEHLLLRKSHECLLPRSESQSRHLGDGYREDGKPQVDDTVIYQDSCRCAHGGRCRRSAFKNKASEKLLQGVCGGLEITVGHSLPRASGWCSCLQLLATVTPPSSPLLWVIIIIKSPPPLPRRPLLCQLGGFGDVC